MQAEANVRGNEVASAAQEEAKHDSEENEPVMMNPQDMIDDFESANAKKVQIISKIESRMKAKDKLLDQRY